MKGEEMSLEEMQIRRAIVRREFDLLRYQHRHIGEQLDAMALELDRLAIEITVARVRQEMPPAIAHRNGKPLRMEMV